VRYVAVYPDSPSPPLTAALLAAGYNPVPIDSVGAASDKQPPVGWHGIVVELGNDPDTAATFAAKVREELDVDVMLVLDRTLTHELEHREGFNDFILTPIDPVELAVRLSRFDADISADTSEDIVRFEDLELNTGTYQATIAGRPVDLTYMEYELLRFLVENMNRVWSREQLLSKVWGYDYFGGSRTVDVHIRRLRAKLGEERASWITTVRSVGYRFG